MKYTIDTVSGTTVHYDDLDGSAAAGAVVPHWGAPQWRGGALEVAKSGRTHTYAPEAVWVGRTAQGRAVRGGCAVLARLENLKYLLVSHQIAEFRTDEPIEKFYAKEDRYSNLFDRHYVLRYPLLPIALTRSSVIVFEDWVVLPRATFEAALAKLDEADGTKNAPAELWRALRDHMHDQQQQQHPLVHQAYSLIQDN
jgi:hypothetical protein